MTNCLHAKQTNSFWPFFFFEFAPFKPNEIVSYCVLTFFKKAYGYATTTGELFVAKLHVSVAARKLKVTKLL